MRHFRLAVEKRRALDADPPGAVVGGLLGGVAGHEVERRQSALGFKDIPLFQPDNVLWIGSTR